MNTCFRLWSLGLGLMAACPVLWAQPLPWPADTAPAESVLKKTTRLIREDAGLPSAPYKPDPVLPPKDSQENVLKLDVMIVREKNPPAILPALHETPVAEFLRTGTIWKRIGRKFTTEFWARGDKGIMLSFSW